AAHKSLACFRLCPRSQSCLRTLSTGHGSDVWDIRTSYSLPPPKTGYSLPPQGISCSLAPAETDYSLPPEGLVAPYLLRRLATPYLLRGLATPYLLRRH
ncbi:hypothetical protein Tco_0056846, partial [Tanacetum coccineum]